MWPIMLTIVFIMGLIYSITVVVMKRRRAGITDIKSALSSICLYLLAVVNICAYWFGFMGIISWTISVCLLIVGAYFTKYIPVAEG